MRIIAGTARRTLLEVAEDSSTRPFLEMARGALFNSLGDKVIGATILDLYAGSGALGLEALSRGAASCLFIERDRKAFAALEKNIINCDMTDKVEKTRMDVAHALADNSERFDLVFVDPPFPELAEWQEGGRCQDVMEKICRLTADNGLVIFRFENRKATPPKWPGLQLLADRSYGRSRICRYGRM